MKTEDIIQSVLSGKIYAFKLHEHLLLLSVVIIQTPTLTDVVACVRDAQRSEFKHNPVSRILSKLMFD